MSDTSSIRADSFPGFLSRITVSSPFLSVPPVICLNLVNRDILFSTVITSPDSRIVARWRLSSPYAFSWAVDIEHLTTLFIFSGKSRQSFFRALVTYGAILSVSSLIFWYPTTFLKVRPPGPYASSIMAYESLKI